MSKEKQQTTQSKPTAEVTPTELETALTQENEKLITENESLQQENQKLKKTCDRLQSSADKSDTYLNQLVAMKSDFESYKRRMKVNTEQAMQQGVEQVVTKLLPLADTFEIAEKSITDENSLQAFTMVHQELKNVLTEMGVEKLEVMGLPFDHNTMNALSKMDRGQDNTDKVVEVYKNGYKMGDKIIRYAQVIVGA